MSELNNTFIGTVSFQNFLLFLFVLIFTFVLGSLFNMFIIKSLKEKVRPIIYNTISKIAMYTVYVLGFYLAFVKIIDFSIPAGLAALGILGITLLLPATPLLQGIAAGILLAIERPFKEEDVIDVNGTLCKVKDIMLRKTRLRSLDGRIIIVPNYAFITTMPVINYSKGEFIRVTLDIDITTDSDKDKAAQIIEKICYNNPNILPNIPEKKINKITKIFTIPTNFFTTPKNIKQLSPKIMIKNVNKDKITLEVWFWTWDILVKERIISHFYEELITEFKKENIKFG